MQVFLSHSSADRTLADALKQLLADYFDGRVTVVFSSDDDSGGGIAPGANWLQWITTQIAQADSTFVLLTPTSLVSPWVLWESGAAAGLAMARDRIGTVVPVTFGLADDEVPTPYRATQRVRGDAAEGNGIQRLLHSVNATLGEPVTSQQIDDTSSRAMRAYLAAVQGGLQRTSPGAGLLGLVPPSFPASYLEGHWVSCYQFRSASSASPAHSCSLVRIEADSERSIRASDIGPEPRTQGHRLPFRNEIEAELVSRHLLGRWKNTSDLRYFGAVHLAVLQSGTVMTGTYSSYDSDIAVGGGRWIWARLDPASVEGAHLDDWKLSDPSVVWAILDSQDPYDQMPRLDDIASPT